MLCEQWARPGVRTRSGHLGAHLKEVRSHRCSFEPAPSQVISVPILRKSGHIGAHLKEVRSHWCSFEPAPSPRRCRPPRMQRAKYSLFAPDGDHHAHSGAAVQKPSKQALPIMGFRCMPNSSNLIVHMMAYNKRPDFSFKDGP